MAYFFDSAARTPKELLPGIHSRTFWGDRMLLSLVDLAPNAAIPPHSHPHEQLGLVVHGEMELTIAGETRVVKEGDVYVVPGDVVHSVWMAGEPCQVVETFAPVREEYKFPD
jgi:quercetin dioxygenase-like cupin family protein